MALHNFLLIEDVLDDAEFLAAVERDYVPPTVINPDDLLTPELPDTFAAQFPKFSAYVERTTTLDDDDLFDEGDDELADDEAEYDDDALDDSEDWPEDDSDLD